MYNPVCKFVVLFADIHEKSVIFERMEIMLNELHHLMGVTVLNASMAHRR